MFQDDFDTDTVHDFDAAEKIRVLGFARGSLAMNISGADTVIRVASDEADRDGETIILKNFTAPEGFLDEILLT